jgi:hypothetical protein
MSNYTLNTPSFIEAQQYSQFILRTLPTAILPQGFFRDVSDFGAGSTLNIKTIGTATIQEVEEDSPLIYNPIETGNITLSITDYIGDAWYVTDVLRQDGSQIEALMAARAQEATRAIQQRFESRFYQVAYNGQTAANQNLVNGFAHRARAQGTNWTMSEDDLISMRLAFDKANVPQFGRVAIVDPVVAATFQKKVVITSQLNMQPAFMELMKNGFNNEHQFVMRLHGWDIWTSNLLPQVAAGTSVDGNASSSASTTCVANLFMCVADDNCKPVMNAWRQPPKVEGERNKDRQRDEFLTTARWGMGIQRRDTLGVIVSDATKTA